MGLTLEMTRLHFSFVHSNGDLLLSSSRAWPGSGYKAAKLVGHDIALSEISFVHCKSHCSTKPCWISVRFKPCVTEIHLVLAHLIVKLLHTSTYQGCSHQISSSLVEISGLQYLVMSHSRVWDNSLCTKLPDSFSRGYRGLDHEN